MPHPNALKQLKSYGPIAVELDRLTDEVIKNTNLNKSAEECTENFKVYCDTHNVQSTILALQEDKYAYNRELAIVTVEFLWMCKEAIPYQGDTAAQRKEYKQEVKAFRDSLEWTLPVTYKALQDKHTGPVELGLLAVKYMETESKRINKKLEKLMLPLAHHPSKDVRLKLTDTLVRLYPQVPPHYDWQISDEGINALIFLSRDTEEEIRDAACFEMQSAANPRDDMELALIERMNDEDPESVVYIEAICGLAYIGRNDLADPVIIEWLLKDAFGTGVLRAASTSGSPEVIEAFIAAYNRVKDQYPNNWILDEMENELELWNLR